MSNPEGMIPVFQTATVGRNVKGVPMDMETWSAFCHELKGLFDHVEWMTAGASWSPRWGTEDTFTIGGYPGVQPEAVLNLAHFYGQEAVSLGMAGACPCTEIAVTPEEWQ